MVACVVPSCSNTRTRAPEKHFFMLPSEKKMRERWCRRIKINCDFPGWRKATVCEDHFNFERDLENYMKVRLMKATPVLRKQAMPSACLSALQPQVSPKDGDASLPDGCSGSRTILPPGALYSCVSCERVFSSQRSLAAHSSECILHLGFMHTWARISSSAEPLGSARSSVESQMAITSSPVAQPVPGTASRLQLQEKVMAAEGEAWLVTSATQGHQCVFVVEAEGSCMLQQEIPAQQPWSSADQDIAPLGPLWGLSLQAEDEEERYHMEHKMVVDPWLAERSFGFACVRRQGEQPQQQECLEEPSSAKAESEEVLLEVACH